MRASFDFGSGNDGLAAGRLPFRILVIGSFAGDSAPRAGGQAPPATGRSRPRRVEAETFDELMQAVLGPLTLTDLAWPGAAKPVTVTLRLDSLKALRPESLALQVPGGREALAARELLVQLKARRTNLREVEARLAAAPLDDDLRRRLTEALGGAGARAANAAAPEAPAPAASPSPPPAAPQPSASGGSSLDNLFALVDEAGAPSPGPSAPASEGSDPAVSALSGLISAIAGGGAPGTPGEAAKGVTALAALDGWLGERLNSVLADPRFRRREAAWRGLRLLLQRAPARAGVMIDLLDGGAGDPPLLDIIQALAEAAEAEPGGRTPYSLVVSLADWTLDEAGLALLEAVAAQAAALQLPLVASARLDALADLTEALADRWQDLGRRPEAGWLGLAVNPFLLRGRYAADGEPVKGFDFVESADDFESDGGPWAAPSLGVAVAAAQSFARDGWPTRFEGADGGTLESLPVRSIEHGGRSAQSSGQAVLPDKVAGLLGQSGFIALVPALDRDEVVIFRAPSLKSPLARPGGTGDAAARLETSLPFALAVSRLAALLTQAIQKLPGSSVSAEDVAAGLDRVLSAQGIGAVHARDARVALTPSDKEPGHVDVLVRWRPGPPVLPAGAMIELSLPFPI